MKMESFSKWSQEIITTSPKLTEFVSSTTDRMVCQKLWLPKRWKLSGGNALSLLGGEINWWLNEGLIFKWDITDRVFLFGIINLCLTIEEYLRILGVPYNTEFNGFLSFNQGFRWRISKTLRIKKNILEKGGETDEHPLSLLYDLFSKWSAFEKNREIFMYLCQEWSHNWILVFELILRHIKCSSYKLHPWRSTYWITIVLITYQGRSSLRSSLLANTFRALEIARTFRPSYLECCIWLLQVLNHLIACRPFITKDLFQEDLIHDHL